MAWGARNLISTQVVVGCGETAFDVAHAAAANNAAHVTLATRRGFVSVPACVENQPVCRVHPINLHQVMNFWSTTRP